MMQVTRIRIGRPGVPSGMKDMIVRRSTRQIDRLRLLGPVLIVAAALIVAACNNGSGGTGY
jgi:hypothetical protein